MSPSRSVLLLLLRPLLHLVAAVALPQQPLRPPPLSPIKYAAAAVIKSSSTARFGC